MFATPCTSPGGVMITSPPRPLPSRHPPKVGNRATLNEPGLLRLTMRMARRDSSWLHSHACDCNPSIWRVFRPDHLRRAVPWILKGSEVCGVPDELRVPHGAGQMQVKGVHGMSAPGASRTLNEGPVWALSGMAGLGRN